MTNEEWKQYEAELEEVLQEEIEKPQPETSRLHNPLPNGSYFEAKEKREAAERDRRRRSFPYPVFVTAAYLLLGILLDAWHPGWIVFLTIPLFYLSESDRKPLRLLSNPVMLLIIYLLLGCVYDLWHIAWLVFLLIPLLQNRKE